MRGAAWVGDDGFHIAQIGGDGHQLCAVYHGERIGAAVRHRLADDIKSQDRSTHARLLRHGQRMLRVTGQTREIDLGDFGMVF